MGLEKNDMQSSHLRAQLEEYIENYHQADKKASVRRKALTSIAEKICDHSYGDRQLGGENALLSMSDNELRDFIVDNWTKQKSELIKNIRDLQEELLRCHRELDDANREILRLQQEGNRQPALESRPIEDEEEGFDYPQDIPEDAFDEEDEDPPSPSHDAKEELASLKEDTSIFRIDGKVYDAKVVMQKLNVLHLAIVEAIGASGRCEFSGIMEEACKHQQAKESNYRNIINELVEQKVLESETISTPIRSKISLYRLSSMGEWIYRSKTHRKAVLNEKDRLIQQHATLEHAYCIKDTANILISQGYKNVCTNSSDNQFKVAGGSRYVPDIVATRGKEQTYWEVELAHHSDAAFIEKMDKASKITNEVYIITPREEERAKIERQIRKYQKHVFEIDSKIKFHIWLGTMHQLNDRKILSNPKQCCFPARSES